MITTEKEFVAVLELVLASGVKQSTGHSVP